jgi:hypothetical protein
MDKLLSQLDLASLRSGKIFSVQFVKRDGSVRAMLARTGVKKHLKGGELKYNPAECNKLVVWSFDSKGYRTINTDAILKLKHDGDMYINEHLTAYGS